MRVTLSILAFALVFGAWAAPAAAQRRDGPPDPEARIERMTERLDLGEAQAARVRAILEEQARERTEILARGRSPETRDRMLELRERTHERLGEVLSEEQMGELREMGPRGRAGGRGMRGRPGKGGGQGKAGCHRGSA